MTCNTVVVINVEQLSDFVIWTHALSDPQLPIVIQPEVSPMIFRVDDFGHYTIPIFQFRNVSLPVNPGYNLTIKKGGDSPSF